MHSARVAAGAKLRHNLIDAVRVSVSGIEGDSSSPGEAAGARPDPLTPDEVETVLKKARFRFPEWYPFLLCALRIGMRLGELLELQWSDIHWRSSYVEVRRAFVDGVVTTPKNHQCRRVDLSRQLRAELRLWRRRERAAWLKKGRAAPPWGFASVSATRLDPSNVRKAFDRILTAAEVHHRGLHEMMRHACALLLLQHGAAITYP